MRPLTLKLKKNLDSEYLLPRKRHCCRYYNFIWRPRGQQLVKVLKHRDSDWDSNSKRAAVWFFCFAILQNRLGWTLKFQSTVFYFSSFFFPENTIFQPSTVLAESEVMVAGTAEWWKNPTPNSTLSWRELPHSGRTTSQTQHLRDLVLKDLNRKCLKDNRCNCNSVTVRLRLYTLKSSFGCRSQSTHGIIIIYEVVSFLLLFITIMIPWINGIFHQSFSGCAKLSIIEPFWMK